MATATFTAEGHIYECDGVVVPSVTQVLTLAGIDDVSRIPLHYLERAAGIGTAVHQACEYLDQDDLDLDSVDSSIVGYVLGYQKFKQEHNFIPSAIEKRGIAETDGLQFGYCLDRLGMIGETEVLLDIKTASKKSHSWPIQTAAYADAINLGGTRYIVHVAKEGTYKLIEHEAPQDFEVWRGALQVAHWKLAHGGKLPK
jgi:hypothetical protein